MNFSFYFYKTDWRKYPYAFGVASTSLPKPEQNCGGSSYTFFCFGFSYGPEWKFSIMYRQVKRSNVLLVAVNKSMGNFKSVLLMHIIFVKFCIPHTVGSNFFHHQLGWTIYLSCSNIYGLLQLFCFWPDHFHNNTVMSKLFLMRKLFSLQGQVISLKV